MKTSDPTGTITLDLTPQAVAKTTAVVCATVFVCNTVAMVVNPMIKKGVANLNK